MRASVLSLLSLVVVSCGEEQISQVQNEPPVAVIGALAVPAQVGVAVTFSGADSSDVDGEIVSYAWDFAGVAGSGVTAAHIFNAGGTFAITLTVTDDAGATATDTLIVDVSDNQGPTAVISAPAAGSISGTLLFDGSTSSDPDGAITAYDWDFGDGTTGSGATINKAFAAAGTFTVALTVTDNEGATDRAEHSVTIAAAPPSFSGDWNWFLTDESVRDLGLLCGTFQDSQLVIAQNGTSLTITERAGSVSVNYTGTITDNDFSVQNGTLAVQRIVGTFTSATTFTGVYQIESGITTCADRPVEGVKQ